MIVAKKMKLWRNRLYFFQQNGISIIIWLPLILSSIKNTQWWLMSYQHISILRYEVKKQYEQELIQARKQNETLNGQIKALNKTLEDGQKLHDAQLRKAQEQNTELQKNIDKINGSITELTKKNMEYAQQAEKYSSRIDELEADLKKRPNWFIVILFSSISAALAIWIFTQTHMVL